jgi:transcription antitermination factor NusG
LPETEMMPRLQAVSSPSWHVLWTRSNCEQLVCNRLTAQGLEVFLPKIGSWSRRGGQRHLVQVPMFPGYLFVHHVMDKASYIEVCKSPGLVSILGARWDRLEVVPSPEIEAIQRALRAKLPVLPHPFLREGQRVRITRGPLADVEGIFLRSNPTKGLLVVSINMLRRSVAVAIDSTLVEAA